MPTLRSSDVGSSPLERIKIPELQQSHLELALAAEPEAGGTPPGAYSFLMLHVQRPVAELKPDSDARVLANPILGGLTPPILQRLQADPEIDQESLKTGIIALLRGITA
jgi:hypothetical protein